MGLLVVRVYFDSLNVKCIGMQSISKKGHGNETNYRKVRLPTVDEEKW